MDTTAEDTAALAARYFTMWDTGDTADIEALIAPHWVDHAHPEVSGPAAVAATVQAVRAARPSLRFRVDAVLRGTDPTDPVAVVGAATTVDNPTGGTPLVWLFTARDGRLTTLRTFRDNTT